MEPELISTVTQFGMAGLIACLWLIERRWAGVREKQLTDAHDRLLEQRVQVEALMRIVTDNTRAITAVEAGQRGLAELLTRLARRRGGAREGPRRADRSRASGAQPPPVS